MGFNCQTIFVFYFIIFFFVEFIIFSVPKPQIRVEGKYHVDVSLMQLLVKTHSNFLSKAKPVDGFLKKNMNKTTQTNKKIYIYMYIEARWLVQAHYQTRPFHVYIPGTFGRRAQT